MSSVFRVPKQLSSGTVPSISLSAHGLDHPGCAENLAVIGGGVLAAAIGMVDQPHRLPLEFIRELTSAVLIKHLPAPTGAYQRCPPFRGTGLVYRLNAPNPCAPCLEQPFRLLGLKKFGWLPREAGRGSANPQFLSSPQVRWNPLPDGSLSCALPCGACKICVFADETRAWVHL
jgi:hypothetical protein